MRKPFKRLDPKTLFRWDKKQKAYSIDVLIDYYRDVYNEWDFSPVQKREIDKDLIEFLEDCVKEIPFKAKIIINFHMPSLLRDEEKEARSKKSLENYFIYLIRKIEVEKSRMVGNTLLYFVTGSIFLVSALFIQKILGSTMIGKILPEGLIIGGWVLLWEIFSIVFFKLKDINFRRKIYRKLLTTKITYVYMNNEVH